MISISKITLFPNYYEVKGYANNRFFIMELDTDNNEVLKFRHDSILLKSNLQNEIQDCAKYLLNSNSYPIQYMSTESESKDAEE